MQLSTSRFINRGRHAVGLVFHGPGFFLLPGIISNRGSRGSLPLALGESPKAILMIKIKEYDLPDVGLLSGRGSGIDMMVWVPSFFCIVLGQSNRPGDSIHVGVVEAEGIPVYKRPSGGETVILSPDTLVISYVKRNEPLRSPRRYFSLFNGKIVEVLAGLGVGGLGQRGISDICIGNKKILGSSIYRSKDLLFYHGVLNISEPVSSMERYLKHPSREPDYRVGRSHSDFVTSLFVEGYRLSIEAIREALLI